MYRPLGMLAMVRRSQEEAVVALDASTGTTVWEHKYPSSTTGINFTEGAGPHSTPLVTADRVFAAGSRKELFALNKANGQVVWSHDLIKEYGAPGPDRGYACSPLLYNDMLIVSVGGPGQALAAFNPKTGALIWKAGDFEFSPASPIIIDVDGQKQLLYFAGNVVAGLNPATGQTLWTHPHKTDWGLNISTPILVARRPPAVRLVGAAPAAASSICRQAGKNHGQKNGSTAACGSTSDPPFASAATSMVRAETSRPVPHGRRRHERQSRMADRAFARLLPLRGRKARDPG